MEADPPKRKRRGFQFSLRTLLTVVTLLAVAVRLCRVAGEHRDGTKGRNTSRPAEARFHERGYGTASMDA
jgi:hypothetical protein